MLPPVNMFRILNCVSSVTFLFLTGNVRLIVFYDCYFTLNFNPLGLDVFIELNLLASAAVLA